MHWSFIGVSYPSVLDTVRSIFHSTWAATSLFCSTLRALFRRLDERRIGNDDSKMLNTLTTRGHYIHSHSTILLWFSLS